MQSKFRWDWLKNPPLQFQDAINIQYLRNCVRFIVGRILIDFCTTNILIISFTMNKFRFVIL